MTTPTRNITDLEFQETHDYGDDDGPRAIGTSFFRGGRPNLSPYLRDFAKSRFIERFVVKGWTPAAPLIDETTRVTAFGSCFAQNITRHLSEIGYSVSQDRNPNIYISMVQEGLVNVHALLEQFEWALEDKHPPAGLWHDYRAQEMGYDEAVRLRTRDAFLSTDFFILTLGLSEVWYDEPTGGVFWRAVPKDRYDPDRHKFRVCTFAETKAALGRMIALITKHCPQARVLFTLSPVPLAATFRPVSAIAANASSKAILRAALDEVCREAGDALNERLFYFPSYEIITDLVFSRYSEDGRHPHPEVIDLIMRVFEAAFCKTGLTFDALNEQYRQMRAENGRVAMEQAQQAVSGSRS